MKLIRKEGSVFVDVPKPQPKQILPPLREVRPLSDAESRLMVKSDEYVLTWTGIAEHIKGISPAPVHRNPASFKREKHQRVTTDRPVEKAVTSDTEVKTADDVLADTLPTVIANSSWGKYIQPGSASRIQHRTIFVYHDPSAAFWRLYNLAKGLFRDLGIKLSKRSGVWVANIPIKCLTDKVFVASGLAAVENTLLSAGINSPVAADASSILEGIRHRQFSDTQRGIKKCKGIRSEVREAVGDAVGVLAITAVAWATYIVMGVA